MLAKRLTPIALVLCAALIPGAGVSEAGTALEPKQRTVSKPAQQRISKAKLLVVVRDFRDRLGADKDLYYLVNPPGGATEEERAEFENEITHFLSRIHKDPTLDFPSKWIRDLREYELTGDEWSAIERHFRDALAASKLAPSVRASLTDRFSRLRSEVLAPIRPE